MSPQKVGRVDHRSGAVGTMSPDQAVQLIAWLDEEHRKDKAQMSEILDRLSQQYTQIAGLSKSVQDMEERLARLQSQALRYSQIEQTVNQMNAQVQIAMDQYDQQRQHTEEEAFKLRQLEREREDKILDALQMQVEALQQWQRSIVGDHDILTRLELTLPGEIQNAIERSEDYDRRLLNIEEWVNRSGQLTAELHQLSERLRQERAEAAEAGRRAEQQRARHMAEWGEQIKALRSEFHNEIDIAELRSQQKEGQKRLTSLQELEERLKQMEARLVNWQRLVEEGRRKEHDQLLTNTEKRWQQQLGEWQFLRDEWIKRLTAMTDRLSVLEDWRAGVINSMHEFMDKIDQERRARLAMITDVLKVESEVDRQRSKSVEELLKQLESEKAGLKKPPPGE